MTFPSARASYIKYIHNTYFSKSWLLCALAFASVVWVALGLHSSSILRWELVVPSEPPTETIFGEPRPIKSDEWLVSTPFAFSQTAAVPPLPAENPALGQGRIPLIGSLPSWELATLFRPYLWGYFFLDAERGLSFVWWYRWVALLTLSTALFSHLFHSNGIRRIPCFIAALLFCFSDPTQWWMTQTIPEQVANCCGLVLCGSIWYKTRSRLTVWLTTIAGSYLVIQAGLFFYPPFTLPILLSAASVILAIWCTTNFPKEVRTDKYLSVIVAAALVGIIYGSILYAASDTLNRMMNTSYPGRRSFEQTGIPFTQNFLGYYGFWFTDNFYPVALGNVCEASKYVMFWPLLLLASTGSIKSWKHQSLLHLLTLAATIFGLASLFGLPSFITKATGLSMVQPTRFIIGVGVINWIAFSAWCIGGGSIPGLSRRTALLTTAVLAGSLVYLTLQLEPSVQLKLTQLQAGSAIALWTTVSFLFLRGRRILALSIVAAVLVAGNARVNPLSIGAGSLLHSPVSKFVQSKVKENPNARWLIVYDTSYAQLVKSNGGIALNGIHYLPPDNWLSILDPKGERSEIHNRYAHISVTHNPNISEPVFHLHNADIYSIQLNLCGDAPDKLKVDYLLVATKDRSALPRCNKDWSHSRLSRGVHVYTLNREKAHEHKQRPSYIDKQQSKQTQAE